jgi:uncharacterized membrane protein YqaE (UPF0057 family)
MIQEKEHKGVVLALLFPPLAVTNLNQSPRAMFLVPSNKRCSKK